jgi:ubiquinone/menaquinone biosynthesis C-methylase UbiE
MNQDKLWDAFQNDPALQQAFRATPRFRKLVALLRPGDRVLNIGVGDGGFERMATKMGMVLSCLDPSQQSIESLRTDLGIGSRAQQGYSDAIPFPDASFDAVVMSEVIEHLDDAQIASTLREVSRVLSPYGCFIGTVPADEDLPSAQVVCPHCAGRFHRWGHLQSFSRECLVKMLTPHFSAISVQRIYCADWSQLNWKGRLTAVVKQVALALGVNGAQETFLFQARRH